MQVLTTTAMALPALWLAEAASAQTAETPSDDEPAAESPAAGLQEAKFPPVSEQLEDPKNAAVTVVGHVVEPVLIEATDERVESLDLPRGTISRSSGATSSTAA